VLSLGIGASERCGAAAQIRTVLLSNDTDRKQEKPMTKTETNKLTLRRETLRSLTPSELRLVAGGGRKLKALSAYPCA
jgi:hypothetical protein